MMHGGDVERGPDSYPQSSPSATAVRSAGHHAEASDSSAEDDYDDEQEETPKVKALFALFLLLGVTAITGVTAEFLIDSVNGLTETTSISKEFVGLILFPLVGNATEHVAAVTVSVKDKLK
jgi:Ca2+:H+ antiporter